MPKEGFVVVTGIVHPNLVVLRVGEHDVEYTFCCPNRKIMSPQGEAKEAG